MGEWKEVASVECEPGDIQIFLHDGGKQWTIPEVFAEISRLSCEGALKDAVIKRALQACESCMSHSSHSCAKDEIEVVAGILRCGFKPQKYDQQPSAVTAPEGS